MSKAFLSHSSKDKQFVAGVADSLGSALCHYDERTFEPAGESAEEIILALHASDIFVLFLSKNSLDSAWVRSEIKYAKHLYFAGEIREVAIFLLGDACREALDIWLRPFVVQTLMVPRLVAFRIRSLLTTTGRMVQPRFIGRDEEVSKVKDLLRDLSAERPSAVIASGQGGIGRKRVMARVYQDLYPFLPTQWISLDVAAFESEVALFEKLSEHFDAEWGWGETTRKIESFVAANPADRFAQLARLMAEIERSKQVVVLQSADDLVTADGRIVPWLLTLIRSTKTSYPVLVVTTARSPSPIGLLDITDIPYIKVGSIQEKNAKQLLSLLCQDLNIEIGSELLNTVISFVGGHPGLIEITAKLIKATGVNRFKIELTSVDGKSAIEEYVEKAISNVNLVAMEKAILLLLDEVGGATREDIVYGFGESDEELVVSRLARLFDFGLVEESGAHIQVASHLRLVMRRWRSQRELVEILISVRQRLVKILEQAESISGGSYIALRASIAAGIREDGDFKSILVSRPLLAAQQLRVARRLYDERNLADAALRAVSAYENRIALSDDGVVEVLRLMGLIGVRNRRHDLRDQSLAELGRTGGDKPAKLAAFIKGFEARLAGRFKDAEAQLKVAIKKGGSGDFHVLRELAASLLGQGRTSEAEVFARKALGIAPNNPYVLDILIACLIDRFKQDISDYDLEREIGGIMARLEVSDDRERQTFSQRRRVAFHLAKRDYTGAGVILSKSLGASWHRSVNAEYLRLTGNPRGALAELDLARKERGDIDDESLREESCERPVKIISLAQSGRPDEAISEFRYAERQYAPKPLEELRRTLIFELTQLPGEISEDVRRFIRAM